jgi:hypothetical protein
MADNKRSLLVATSAIAIAVFIGAPAPDGRAADVDDEVCQSLAGTIRAGYVFGEQDFDGESRDYETLFGEAAALYHFCNTNLNIQADYAVHGHQFDSGFEDNDRWHAGGVLFWRDQELGVLGLDVSFLNESYFDDDFESWRFGVRGEYFVNDMFTLGAGAGYFDGKAFAEDGDGFDVNAWGRIYPTESIGLLARFDYAVVDFRDVNLDYWAVTGEGEYLLPNVPVSIFAGARYAGQEFPGKVGEFSIDDIQAYAGISIYLGSDGNGGSLASHQRNNTLDNTSVILERLPNPFPL